ncbi:prepilin peptidase [Paenibacillus sp. NRS-1783]|uniref:prepilin peptidase n=1 Tax=Paenibacillus sp. NRS-1783 TaxID=3233907 RepID=UPI003D2CF128
MALEGLLFFLCSWCSYTDLKERRISNVCTYAALLILCVIRLFDPVFYLGLVPAILLFLAWLFKPDAIGEGDIKLFAVIGLAIGFNYTIMVLFWTCLGALIFMTLYRVVKSRKLASIPLAPFILIGLFIAIILKYSI